MKKWEVQPSVSVGGVQFLTHRSEVRKQIGLDYKEMKKSIFSKNTMDAYDTFHVFYGERNEMEAIEFFEGNKLTISGKTLFPGKVSMAQKLIPDLMDNEDCYISTNMSIGITVSSDDPEKIESVLVGCKGYYM